VRALEQRVVVVEEKDEAEVEETAVLMEGGEVEEVTREEVVVEL